MATLSQFVQNLHGGGARANQFSVSIKGRDASRGVSSEHFTFLCRSAQIPALTIGEVSVPYRGRQIFVPGDRTYDAWTVTIYNDSEYSSRNDLELWMNELQNIGSGTHASGEYVYRNAVVKQLDRNEQTIRSYSLINCWPTTLDAIDLAYDTNDVIEEFGATFRFNYMLINAHEGARGAQSIGGTGVTDLLPPLTGGASAPKVQSTASTAASSRTTDKRGNPHSPW